MALNHHDIFFFNSSKHSNELFNLFIDEKRNITKKSTKYWLFQKNVPNFTDEKCDIT